MSKQTPEKIMFNGQMRTLHVEPGLPKKHPAIRISTDEEANEGPSSIFSTGCYRQYVGTWAIRDELLYLDHIEGCRRIDPAEPILAEWISGWLCISDVPFDVISNGRARFLRPLDTIHWVAIKNGRVIEQKTEQYNPAPATL